MPEAYLLDIEGTTCPIHFVYEVLFPYARTHLDTYLRAHWNDPAVCTAIALLQQEKEAEIFRAELPYPSMPQREIATSEGAVLYLSWLMSQDRKSTALKAIQGQIWAQGYAQGLIKSDVFADVPAALARWHGEGLVAIYSSGSVEAQRNLFAYTGYGDLTSWIHHYFDTTVGPKTAPTSYRSIASILNLETNSIIFISDSVRELNAAREAGLPTLISLRPGNASEPDLNGHRAITSFDEC